MRRNSGAINYAGGMATSRVGLTNMYIYGGSVLSLLTFVLGLATSGSVAGALNAVIDFYIMRLGSTDSPANHRTRLQNSSGTLSERKRARSSHLS